MKMWAVKAPFMYYLPEGSHTAGNNSFRVGGNNL